MDPALRGASRLLQAAAAAAALVFSVAFPVQASTDVLDQSQTVILNSQHLGIMAQTFTAGGSGTLDRVSLASDTSFGAVRLNVSIQTVGANGAPSGTKLATTSFQGSLTCCRRFHDFTFNPSPALTAHTRYAIVVQVASSLFTWYDSGSIDQYAGGQLYLGCSGCAWFTGSQFGQDFAFETWLQSNANQAPAVAADNAAVTSAEGASQSNTGTYSDADGDAVSLAASSGTLTQTGTNSGTWSWTAAPADESSAQTVTVTADDGHGSTATTTFTTSVTAVAPSVSILTDPPSAPEGTAVSLNASATSPDAADNSAGFTYAWAVTKNGGAYATGAGSSFSFTPDDEGSFVVTVHATDDGAMTGTASTTIDGANVAPTASVLGVSASAPLVQTAQESFNFSGAFADPGRLDTHTVTWNFGDGHTASSAYGPGGSAGFTVSHAYAAAGSYTATLTVTDDDGGVGSAKVNVSVQTPQQAIASIEGYVQGIASLNTGQKNSLLAKLRAASDAAARGDSTAAHNQLNAFVNELQADVQSGRLSGTAAATLQGAVGAVQAAMGTSNRLFEWWPLEA